jgi:hypothetical protein
VTRGTFVRRGDRLLVANEKLGVASEVWKNQSRFEAVTRNVSPEILDRGVVVDVVDKLW